MLQQEKGMQGIDSRVFNTKIGKSELTGQGWQRMPSAASLQMSPWQNSHGHGIFLSSPSVPQQKSGVVPSRSAAAAQQEAMALPSSVMLITAWLADIAALLFSA